MDDHRRKSERGRSTRIGEGARRGIKRK